MKLFRNEFRKNFSLPFYIAYAILFFFNVSLHLNNCFNSNTTYHSAGFTFEFMFQFTYIIFLFNIINIVNIFSSDYKQYTWKNLLCTGTHKNKILLAKLSYATVNSLLILYIPFLLTLGLGTLILGYDANDASLTESFLNFLFDFSSSDAAITMLFKAMLSNTLITLFFISFVLLIAEIFRGSRHVLLLTLAIYAVSNITSSIITLLYYDSDVQLYNLLPFKYCSLLLRDFTFEGMLTGSIVLIIYTILLLTLSFLLFRKRDIPTSK